MVSHFCCSDFTTTVGDMTYIITSKYNIKVVNLNTFGSEISVLFTKIDKRPFSVDIAMDIRVPGWHTMILLAETTLESS